MMIKINIVILIAVFDRWLRMKIFMVEVVLKSIMWLTLPDLHCTTPRVRCTGYATIRDYLSERRQVRTINGCRSQAMLVTFGVP